jgi:hypothetical protein
LRANLAIDQPSRPHGKPAPSIQVFQPSVASRIVIIRNLEKPLDGRGNEVVVEPFARCWLDLQPLPWQVESASPPVFRHVPSDVGELHGDAKLAGM